MNGTRKKQEFDADSNQKRSKLQVYEKQLETRDENIDRKVELLSKKERELTSSSGMFKEKIRLSSNGRKSSRR